MFLIFVSAVIASVPLNRSIDILSSLVQIESSALYLNPHKHMTEIAHQLRDIVDYFGMNGIRTERSLFQKATKELEETLQQDTITFESLRSFIHPLLLTKTALIQDYKLEITLNTALVNLDTIESADNETQFLSLEFKQNMISVLKRISTEFPGNYGQTFEEFRQAFYNFARHIELFKPIEYQLVKIRSKSFDDDLGEIRTCTEKFKKWMKNKM